MAAQSRKTRAAEKKRQLLDAAERVFYRDGDLGMTVRRLAAEAETTSQTIYTYFGSRDAVIDAMYDRVLDEIDRLLVSIEEVQRLAAAFPGKDAAPEIAVKYRSYARARPAHFRMLVKGRGPEGTDPGPVRERRERLLMAIGGQSTPNLIPARAHLLLAATNGFIEAELNDTLAPYSPADSLFLDLVAGVSSRS